MRVRDRASWAFWPTVVMTAVCLLALGGLAFASGGAEGTGRAAKSVTLTIAGSQTWKVPKNAWLTYQPTIDAFQAQNPGIKVEYLLLPDAQTTQVLQTQLATGEPSDIMVYSKVAAESELDAEKNMVDLSSEPWVKRLRQTDLLKAPNGKIYGFYPAIPTDGLGMVYNKDIFSRLGLSIPTVYQDFLSVCEKIKASGIVPIYGPYKDVWAFQIWPDSVWGIYAGKKDPGLWDKINTNKVKWTEVPAILDGLARADKLIKNGYFQPTVLSDDYAAAPAAMSSGKYAMMVIRSWFINDMTEKDPSLHLGMFPIPAFDDPAMNALAQAQIGPVLFVASKAKHIAEAKKYLDFLSQPAQIKASTLQSAGTYLPNFKDVSSPSSPLQPIDQENWDKYIQTGMTCPEQNMFMKVDQNELWKYYQDMIGGAKTPEQVLAAWEVKFDELMKAKGYPGF
jgi:raffinose/stachyose/melibiose transport system substrate-binding protein